MKELILSVLSLVILVPIIFFFPLGLSNKGKGIVVTASFLLANLGFLSQGLIPLWLLWLFLALLVFLITYIIQARFSNLLFVSTSAEGVSKASFIEREPEDRKNNDSEDSVYKKKTDVEKKTSTKDKQASEDREKFVTFEQSELEYEDSGVTENKDKKANSDEQEDNNLSELAEKMDVSFLNIRKEELTGKAEADEVLEPEQKEDISEGSDYLAEIERLLDDEDEPFFLNEYNGEDFEHEEVPEDLQDEGFIPTDDWDAPELSSDYPSGARQEDEVEPDDLSEHLFGLTGQSVSGMEDEDGKQAEVLHKNEQQDEPELHLLPDEDEERLYKMEDEKKDPDDTSLLSSEENMDELKDIMEEEGYVGESDGHIVPDSGDNPIDIMEVQDDSGYDDETESLDYEESEVVQELVMEDSDLHEEIDQNVEINGFIDQTDAKDEEMDTEIFAEDVQSRAPFEETLAEAAPSTSSQTDEDTLQTMNEIEMTERNTTEETRAFRQQMFNLMASQLQTEGKRLPAEDYENLIKDHMVARLSAHDYYTFASMLIEHYIRNKELVKLHGLLCELREKFMKYPILSMEIQYLYEQYFEKAL